MSLFKLHKGEKYSLILISTRSLDHTLLNEFKVSDDLCILKNLPFNTCCIYNKKYPVSFLVAAHIKKRAECTLDEKKDFLNIVAPMCKMGCDELYEKGYIGVVDGSVFPYRFPST